MLCSSILCLSLPPSRGLPFTAHPTLLPKGHRGKRRRPRVLCNLKCHIKVRNSSRPRDTGLRLLIPHSCLSLRSRSLVAEQHSESSLGPASATGFLCSLRQVTSFFRISASPPTFPSFVGQCVLKARSISKQVSLAWSDRALISLGA